MYPLQDSARSATCLPLSLQYPVAKLVPGTGKVIIHTAYTHFFLPLLMLFSLAVTTLPSIPSNSPISDGIYPLDRNFSMVSVISCVHSVLGLRGTGCFFGFSTIFPLYSPLRFNTERMVFLLQQFNSAKILPACTDFLPYGIPGRCLSHPSYASTTISSPAYRPLSVMPLTFFISYRHSSKLPPPY